MNAKFLNIFNVIIICIIPLIITPWIYDYYYLPKIVSIILLCILCVPFYAKYIKSQGHNITTTDACIYMCTIFIILSTINSVNFKQSLTGKYLRYEGLLAFLSYFFIYFVSSKTYIFSKKVVVMLSICASIIGIYAIFQYFGLDPIPKDFIRGTWKTGYAYATIGNPDFLASYIVLILPVFIFGFAYSKKILYLIPSAILFTALLCTKTRGAWIAVMFSFFLLLILSYKSKINIKPYILIIVLITAIIVLFNHYKNNFLSNRFYSIIIDMKSVMKSASDSAGSHRFFIWKRAYSLIFKKPLLGSGPDTFDIVFMSKYGKEWYALGNTSIIDKAHNNYLQMAITCGFPFLVSYIFAVLSILHRALKTYKKNVLIIPLICSISGYIIQDFFNISVISVAPVYWCMLGILFKLSKDTFDDSSANNQVAVIKNN